MSEEEKKEKKEERKEPLIKVEGVMEELKYLPLSKIPKLDEASVKAHERWRKRRDEEEAKLFWRGSI
ncbi:MAG: hypothetical protein QXS32_07700 [Candidatus Nezhaarchaeales archaeon]